MELPEKFQFHPAIPSAGGFVMSVNTAFLLAQGLVTEKSRTGGTGTVIIFVLTLLHALAPVTLRVAI